MDLDELADSIGKLDIDMSDDWKDMPLFMDVSRITRHFFLKKITEQATYQ
jgi:hypothetical protein